MAAARREPDAIHRVSLMRTNRPYSLLYGRLLRPTNRFGSRIAKLIPDAILLATTVLMNEGLLFQPCAPLA